MCTTATVCRVGKAAMQGMLTAATVGSPQGIPATYVCGVGKQQSLGSCFMKVIIIITSCFYKEVMYYC